MEINPERRRISLSMKAAAEELGFEVEVDETIHAEEKPARRRNDKKKADEAPKAEAEAAPAEEAADDAQVEAMVAEAVAEVQVEVDKVVAEEAAKAAEAAE
jgi:small subunit ribosomal protein S1